MYARQSASAGEQAESRPADMVARMDVVGQRRGGGRSLLAPSPLSSHVLHFALINQGSKCVAGDAWWAAPAALPQHCALASWPPSHALALKCVVAAKGKVGVICYTS